MGFRNFDNWKTVIRRVAKEKNVDVTSVQQLYILEEFAEKISHSKYKDSFVLKGGFIVSKILGIDNRTTRDIDTTFTSTIYSKEEIEDIFKEIINVDDGSFFDYSIEKIQEGQADDGYPGFMVMLKAVNGKAKFDLKIDVSNNTLVYPAAITYPFKSMISESEISVMAYPIENIIAEKYETTLDRGEFNTRIRDLFDIAFIYENQKKLIDDALLSRCIIEVSKNRNTLANLNDFTAIIEDLKTSSIFTRTFENYKKKTYPNISITLDDVFSTFARIQKNVNLLLKEMNNHQKLSSKIKESTNKSREINSTKVSLIEDKNNSLK